METLPRRPHPSHGRLKPQMTWDVLFRIRGDVIRGSVIFLSALEYFWTILEIFLWVIWFWILITVFIDIFRSLDLSGGAKALWFLFVLFIPLIGVLVYLIARGGSKSERSVW
jgi:hypothetical protein